jgi:hypothetical protein
MYVYDSGGCISVSEFAWISRVLEKGGGKVIIGVKDDGGQQVGIQKFHIVDTGLNAFFMPIITGVNDSKRVFDVQMSARGPMVLWQERNEYYLSPLQGTEVAVAKKMPAGVIPQLIDGERVVDINDDPLTGVQHIVVTSLEGAERLRFELPSSPIRTTCWRDLVGKGGRYVNTQSPCLPSQNEEVKVFVRTVVCK